MSWPTKVLMVNPKFFKVEYAINPHMVDENGKLNEVDQEKAMQQWNKLKDTFEKLNCSVEVLPAEQGFPDMVFCANQTFPFLKNGQLNFVLSKMQSVERQPEVEFFKTWANKNLIPTHDLESGPFEGMGDALWNYETKEIFAGYGFRTSPEIYQQLEKQINQKIISVELIDDRFYHLDTCLSILNGTTAAFVKEAFTPEGLNTLEKSFSTLLQVPIDEATRQLACNMCTPNGKDIIIQSGAPETVKMLTENNFNAHEIETSEYIKSGGSVFCMKQFLF